MEELSKGNLRKLAREATIFALLGQLLVTVLLFVGAVAHGYVPDRNIPLVIVRLIFFGLAGFPAGLAVWIFCQLVRFAVKG